MYINNICNKFNQSKVSLIGINFAVAFFLTERVTSDCLMLLCYSSVAVRLRARMTFISRELDIF